MQHASQAARLSSSSSSSSEQHTKFDQEEVNIHQGHRLIVRLTAEDVGDVDGRSVGPGGASCDDGEDQLVLAKESRRETHIELVRTICYGTNPGYVSTPYVRTSMNRFQPSIQLLVRARACMI